MFGSHLSIAGSMANALIEAEGLGMDTVQVFTKNQQQWKAKPLADDEVARWKAEVARLGWGGDGASDVGRTVAHAGYLINLASPKDELWEKSIDLMRIEIERCEALGIPFLVHHPGSPTGSGVEFGVARIAAAYARLLPSVAGFKTVCCLENTVGAGSTLGGPFEQLADLRRRIIDTGWSAERIGFCFDTCHAHAAGHDMATVASASAVLAEFDSIAGLANIRAIHLNDSKGALGSRLDRHEHIGEGTIGGPRLDKSGFAAVVNHPALRNVPKIMETPKGDNPEGTPYDTLNLRRLRKLVTEPEPIMGGRPRRGRTGRSSQTRSSTTR
ncbi:MAG: deoxyribonuclease IV [Phycisphaerales bacterium]